ncbi:peptidylprolyl isomerase [Myroides sp. JBRI-B21084]|uniref:peptidylprolyl isomerase n=1 Tax=Myroides sp. JBRI-B21084 TaxID=3119977 RepID=UPI0026E3E668|nr:peptidylprolyl isomerase [Paenimyroides cloacae]WKW45633.1 peptidylprolyl isomerase [Paenimyroides cloacae]
MKLFLKNILMAVFTVVSFVNVQAQQTNKKRIDGIVGVVGNYVILDSDIDNMFIQAKETGYDTSKLGRCELFGTLLENKLFAHQAIQDSIVVTDDEINSKLDLQMDRMVEYYGSVDNVVKFYNKKNIEEFKGTLFDLIKEGDLAKRMQDKLIVGVSITPEEIRQFYNKIPKDSLPMVGEQIELAEIVMKPEITSAQKQAVIDKLNQIRQEVLDGSSFASKVFMYSEDSGSIKTGGLYTIDKKTPFVKEFKDVAFSLKEGEISKPFETDHGYHIIMLEKIVGKNLELRHILIKPQPTDEAIDKAKTSLDELRIRILNKEITFADAARQYSEQKETKQSGGIVLDSSGESRIELNRMEDRILYDMVSNLKVGEVSKNTLVTDASNKQAFKIVQVTNKIPQHLADFSQDYMQIRFVALKAKQNEVLGKWIADNINNTYIFINNDYQNCNFKSNWLKK